MSNESYTRLDLLTALDSPVLNSKPGEERSCLQREVPSTPHPTIAMSLDAKLLGREKADAGDSKQSNKKNDVIAAMV